MANRAAETNAIGSWLLAGLIGGIIAGIVNAILQVVYQRSANRDLQIAVGGPGAPLQDLPVVQTIFVSVLTAVIGGLVAYGLHRWRGDIATLFVVIVVVLTVLSLAAPLMLPVSTGNRLVLLAMHLVAAIITTSALWPLLRRTRH